MSQFYCRNSENNVYDNDDNAAVAYTTINWMVASFTRLYESSKKDSLW